MDASQVWNEYEIGVNHHNQVGLYTETEQAHRLYEGDQWYGVESGSDSLPQLNFVQPLVEYKVAMVAQNTMNITLSPMDYMGDIEAANGVCEALNKYIRRQWERHKMDSKVWDVVSNACIAGDSAIFFYNGEGKSQIIDRTNLFLSDEQNRDIQQQKYIIISERKFVSDIKKEAEANGVDQDQIDLIVADESTDRQVGNDAKYEVKGPEKKCMAILKMWKEDDGIHFVRAVRNVIYQPEVVISGLYLYPIAYFVWMPKKGSARGMGEVTAQKANQIEVNKNLARRAIATKIAAYPKLVYNSDIIEDTDTLTQIGAAIAVSGAQNLDVTKLVSYIMPASISSDAAKLTEELLDKNMELAGAGDAATGQINPEQASGSAIMAVRDQAAIPLNRQSADYKQFIEDIASIWYDLWAIYNPDGMTVTDEDTGEQITIDAEMLQNMRVNIRVDVSPADPISKMARNKFLENLLSSGAIQLEEYVEALDEDSPAPKSKLEDILRKREEKQQQALQMQAQMQAMTPQNGGLPDGMVSMPPMQ